MNVSAIASCTMFEIKEAAGLDSIRFMLQDVGPGAGRFWVECFGEAWSAYWGAMGPRTVREFLLNSDAFYLANCMMAPRKNRSKTTEAYLAKIVAAVLDALKRTGPGSQP